MAHCVSDCTRKVLSGFVPISGKASADSRHVNSDVGLPFCVASPWLRLAPSKTFFGRNGGNIVEHADADNENKVIIRRQYLIRLEGGYEDSNKRVTIRKCSCLMRDVFLFPWALGETMRVPRVEIEFRSFFLPPTCFEAERVIVPRRSLNAGGLCEYGTCAVNSVLFCRRDRWALQQLRRERTIASESLEKKADLSLSASLRVEAVIIKRAKKWIKINARGVLVCAPARSFAF